jgi:ribosomal protein S18 acetylase RimI-like enzyme
MNAAYRGTGPTSWNSEAEFIDGDRTGEAALREEIAQNPEAFLLVVREKSSLRGCVWLKPVGADKWYLGSLAVDAALQNSGLGRNLLAAAEQFAMDRGARCITMSVVNVRDTLIEWYERRGYHLTGERLDFPYGDPRFGVPKRSDLAFVILEKEL